VQVDHRRQRQLQSSDILRLLMSTPLSRALSLPGWPPRPAPFTQLTVGSFPIERSKCRRTTRSSTGRKRAIGTHPHADPDAASPPILSIIPQQRSAEFGIVDRSSVGFRCVEIELARAVVVLRT
jgi:hypothetical protein